MAQLYPSLFSFHLRGISPGRLAKNNHQGESLLSARQAGGALRNPGASMYARQKQLLDLIQDLGWLTPEQQTLNNILAYAARRSKGQI